MLLLTATTASAAPQTLRVATFNASLNRATAGALSRDLTTPDDAQAQRVAAIIQQVRPDVLLLNEFDYDEDGKALRLFLTNYLQRAQYGGRAIEFAYSYTAAVNTGVPSGVDLNNDGRIDDSGQDALGFGQFPGQYGMVLLSKYRIDLSKIRTFRQFLWRDMPGAAMPAFVSASFAALMGSWLSLNPDSGVRARNTVDKAKTRCMNVIGWVSFLCPARPGRYR